MRASERLRAVLLTRAKCDRARSLLQVCKLRPEAASLPGLSIVPPDSASETKGAISGESPESPPEHRRRYVVRGSAAVLLTLMNCLSLFLSSSTRDSVACGYTVNRPFCISKWARTRRIRKVFAIWASSVSQTCTTNAQQFNQKEPSYSSLPTFEI